jgi:hypothetical protein
MRGRGIGTARGRATIMRGSFYYIVLLTSRLILRSLFQPTVCIPLRKSVYHGSVYSLTFFFSTARSWSPGNSTRYQTVKKKDFLTLYPVFLCSCLVKRCISPSHE